VCAITFFSKHTDLLLISKSQFLLRTHEAHQTLCSTQQVGTSEHKSHVIYKHTHWSDWSRRRSPKKQVFKII